MSAGKLIVVGLPMIAVTYCSSRSSYGLMLPYYGTKIEVIRKNAHQYSVSTMCKVLQVSRSTYYFEINKQKNEKKINQDSEINEIVVKIFNSNRKCFGTRRIKIELDKQGLKVSRRRIGRVMRSNNLVSTYTIASYKPHPSNSNERSINNGLDRVFNRTEPLKSSSAI